MNPPPVTIKSYLPPVKKERSNLQQVKDKYRSFSQTNKEGIPKDLNELKSIKNREHGISFLNQYMNINKKVTKSQYCQTNHISHNSLNMGLNLLGHKTRVNETKPDQTRSNETKPDQIRSNEINQQKEINPQLKKSIKKIKGIQDIKGGKSYEDEEIDEMINNSLSNLHT